MLPVGWFLLAIGAAEYYRRYVTPEKKMNWESSVKMHHGEAGALMTLLGLLERSPGLAAAGVGLMAHDWPDRNKWFTGDRQ